MTAFGPKLTCEMVALLQGWDDGEFKWTFTGPKTARYRQIGNAFPPPIAKALGVAIASALNRETEKHDVDPDPEHDFVYRALRDTGEFMTAAQIVRHVGLEIDDPEIDKRISLLSRDFELLKEEKHRHARLQAWRLQSLRWPTRSRPARVPARQHFQDQLRREEQIPSLKIIIGISRELHTRHLHGCERTPGRQYAAV